MEKFPELLSGQVALMRVDTNTGIVLDEQFKRSKDEIQKVYTVFDNENDALSVVREIMIERQDIEFIIYKSENKVLHFIRPD
jgi:hypothetical protein